MPVAVVHDFLQETENGYTLNLYLSRNSETEFAGELGTFENPLDERYVVAYIRMNHPQTPVNHVRVVTGEGDVVTLSYMTLLAGVRG